MDLLTHLITLVAAFSGAWFAFLLNDRAKARETTRQQVAALNRAQFTLIRQLNTLKTLQSQVIDPVRQHPGRYVAMRALLPVRDEVPPPDLDGLSFLLETDDRNLILEIMIESQRFNGAVQALNERSLLHREKVQPLLDPADIREGGTYSDTDFVRALGEPLYLTLKRVTENAIDNVDRSVSSCEALSARFYEAMKKRFPKHVIIQAGAI